MKKIKKGICGVLAVLMCLSVAACSAEKEPDGGKTGADGQGEQSAVDYEKPYEGNAAILPMQVTSSYDEEAEALRQDILNLEDSVEAEGIVYYISPKGDDDNDGTTPETAWKSVTWLDTVEPGCTVLFERGGVYRGNFSLVTGVTYAAYGQGAKPAIYGSLQNYADASLWTEFSTNIWKIELPTATDIGNMVFDHGAKAGVRVFSSSALNQDYTFLYQDKVLYLYLSTGNPGELHEQIEISDTVHIMRGNAGATNITIENLCLKYGAAHGISFGGDNENITIRGCEIGYIGGGCPNGSSNLRYGNGIEFWSNCKNITVENCWVYQCYDAGITHQTSTAANQEEIKIQSNLVEYCQYALEFFNEHGMTKNVSYTDNVLRFAGYQIFDPKDRRGSNSSMTSLLCVWRHENPCENFVVSNNVFDTSYGYLAAGHYISVEGKNPVLTNNIYIQQSQKATYFLEKDSENITASVTRTVDDIVYAVDSQETLEQGVEVIDKAPQKVIFE